MHRSGCQPGSRCDQRRPASGLQRGSTATTARPGAPDLQGPERQGPVQQHQEAQPWARRRSAPSATGPPHAGSCRGSASLAATRDASIAAINTVPTPDAEEQVYATPPAHPIDGQQDGLAHHGGHPPARRCRSTHRPKPISASSMRWDQGPSRDPRCAPSRRSPNTSVTLSVCHPRADRPSGDWQPDSVWLAHDHRTRGARRPIGPGRQALQRGATIAQRFPSAIRRAGRARASTTGGAAAKDATPRPSIGLCVARLCDQCGVAEQPDPHPRPQAATAAGPCGRPDRGRGVIVHGGHVGADDESRAMSTGSRPSMLAADGLPDLHREHRWRHGSTMARELESIGYLWDAISRSRRTSTRSGSALDTCHAHASGEELPDLVDHECRASPDASTWCTPTTRGILGSAPTGTPTWAGPGRSGVHHAGDQGRRHRGHHRDPRHG